MENIEIYVQAIGVSPYSHSSSACAHESQPKVSLTSQENATVNTVLTIHLQT